MIMKHPISIFLSLALASTSLVTSIESENQIVLSDVPELFYVANDVPRKPALHVESMVDQLEQDIVDGELIGGRWMEDGHEFVIQHGHVCELNPCCITNCPLNVICRPAVVPPHLRRPSSKNHDTVLMRPRRQTILWLPRYHGWKASLLLVCSALQCRAASLYTTLRFFEARNSPETAPLILWLNGGPGTAIFLSSSLMMV